jgi:hypothetical protein
MTVDFKYPSNKLLGADPKLYTVFFSPAVMVMPSNSTEIEIVY